MKINGVLSYADNGMEVTKDKAKEMFISVRFDELDSLKYSVLYNIQTRQARILWKGHDSEMQLEDDECMALHAFVRNDLVLDSDIAKLIHENDVSVWDSNLGESYQAVALEDTDTVKYNGWFDKVLDMERQLKLLLTV